MEKLDLTKEILKKYGIGFDLVRKGDVLNKNEVRIRDVFNNDKKIDKMSTDNTAALEALFWTDTSTNFLDQVNNTKDTKKRQESVQTYYTKLFSGSPDSYSDIQNKGFTFTYDNKHAEIKLSDVLSHKNLRDDFVNAIENDKDTKELAQNIISEYFQEKINASSDADMDEINQLLQEWTTKEIRKKWFSFNKDWWEFKDWKFTKKETAPTNTNTTTNPPASNQSNPTPPTD